MKFLALTFVVAAGLFGQSADTGVLGTVSDQSGSVVVGASVTISSQAIGFNKSVTTGADGQYELRYLLPEEYVVEVHMSGFRPERTAGITLRIGQLARVDFRLQVGALTEEIQVNAQGILLDTQSATMAATVSEERIVDLPLNGRSYVSLGNLVPGVQASGTSFQANGARSFYEQISYDGTSVLQQRSNNSAPSPIIDAIQEFKIQTGDYSAEYGGNAGANVQVQLRSGTNRYHGGAWDFLRNSAMDARGTFRPAPQPKNPLRQNQFGGILSGPIRKDKTFFMAAYEGTRLFTDSPTTTLVFTDAQLAGNFTGFKTIVDPTDVVNNVGTAFPGNIIPAARLDPVALNIAKTYFPRPNVNSTVANLSGASTSSQGVNQVLSRVDQSIGSQDQIFGHYIFYDSKTTNVPLAPQFPTLPHTRNQSYAAQWLHTFSPTKINMVEFGYDRALAIQLSSRAGTTFDAAKTLGINGDLVGGPGGTPLTGNAAGFPSIAVSGYLGIGDSTGGAALDASHTHQLLDVFTWIKGAHSMKMGADIRKLADDANTTNQPFGTFTFDGALSGNAAADFLLGYPHSSVSPQGIPVSAVRQWRYGFFFNDDWKVSNRLTVNLGARYDLFPVPYDAIGTSRTLYWTTPPVFACSGMFPVIGSCLASSTPTLYPNPGKTVPLWQNEYWHIAPRVGLAYRLTGNTVLRAGYGIFTVSPNFDQVNTLQNNPPVGANFTALNPLINPIGTIENPFPAALITAGGTPVYNEVSIEANHKHINPYYQNWNAQIGHEFTKNDVLEVRYVGGKGTYLDSSLLDYNSPPPSGPGAIQPRRPFPTIGWIRMWASDGNSNYHAMQVQYEHRFGHGLSATVSYAYSHLIDDQGGNVNGTRAQSPDARCARCNMRADSQNDIRNRFVAGWTWRIPVGSNLSKGIVGGLLSGWDIGGILTEQDGTPMLITLNGDPQNIDANSSGYFESRPNLVPGQSIFVQNQTPNLWFNPAAFALPGYAYGNAPRNPITAPGAHTLDASLSKSFKLPYNEQHRILFRMEAFNATNTPQWGKPGLALGSSTFSIITSAGANRIMQAALKYSF